MARNTYKVLVTYILIFGISSYNIDDYCKLGEDNIVCERKNFQCHPDSYVCGNTSENSMTINDRNIVLDYHNKLRQKVASGKEPLVRLQAADMNVLSYSLELEYSVQCCVNSCKLKHDKNRMTPKYKRVGQNLGWIKVDSQNFDMTKGIQEWYEEVKDYKDGSNFRYYPNTGHYTQLIWANTKYIGCGKIVFNNIALYGCNYAPFGNIDKKKIFKEGKPCSMCRKGQDCNMKYNALCGETEPFPIDQNFEPPYAAYISENDTIEDRNIDWDYLGGDDGNEVNTGEESRSVSKASKRCKLFLSVFISIFYFFVINI